MPGITLTALAPIIPSEMAGFLNTLDPRMRGVLLSGSLAGNVLGPLFLGAGHLAHQYFNPPAQPPVASVLPEPIKASQ